MTTLHTTPDAAAEARTSAELAARQRLLNAYLRETGTPLAGTGDGLARIALPATECAIVVELVHRGVLGHHVYGAECWIERPGVPRSTLDHATMVALVLEEVGAATRRAFPDLPADPNRAAALAEDIEGSVEATARYLRAPSAPSASTPWARTRHAEQSLVFGHPFHPTPKSIAGFGADLPHFSPELGATFTLHWWGVHPDVLVERRVADGPWVPAEVEDAARRTLAGTGVDYALLPVHPWQSRHLHGLPAVADLLATGKLVDLGPLGPPVYPTSSVRTVCDPGFGTAWKLPLHVRVTNFVRTNPLPHLRRAADAGVFAGALAANWRRHEGFGVLVETGYRTVDPAVAGDEVAAGLAVLFRENPFADGSAAPRVVAGLLEEPARGVPALVEDVCRAAGSAGTPPPAEHVHAWLRRYLAISLVPLLEVFGSDGVSFEAHVQNTLLHTENGWPTRFWVRDMEGVSVSVSRARPDLVEPGSPVLYPDEEAAMRLRYHAVTNHLGHLVHVLARHCGVAEHELWRTAGAVLAASGSAPAADLLARPMLPAKANLLSRFACRGERPLHVDIPNPLFGAAR